MTIWSAHSSIWRCAHALPFAHHLVARGAGQLAITVVVAVDAVCVRLYPPGRVHHFFACRKLKFRM